MLREMAPVAPNPSPDTIIAAAPSRRDRPVAPAPVADPEPVADPDPAADRGSCAPWSAVNSGLGDG